MSEISDEEAKELFGQVDKQEEFNDRQDDNSRQQRSPKRQKRHKKDKKKKKRRHIQEEEQQQQSGEGGKFGQMFEDEASEHSDEEQQFDSEAQILSNDQQRKKIEEVYKRKGIQQSEAILRRLQGKSQKQINAMYKRKMYQTRQNQVLVPSSQDHQTYSVQCRMGKQEQVVFSILKKTQHYRKTKNAKFKIELTSAMAMRKKYPGKVFVEASNQKVIREGLQGLIDVNLRKITRLEHEDYTNLFVLKETQQAQFKKGGYIRIKKGVYEDDLGKIVKLNKNSADVLLVPRVNVQQILIKIKQQVSKMSDQKAIQQKKQQMLKKFMSPRMYYPQNMRPAKKLFQNDNPFFDIDVPFISKINIQKGGLIILNFRLDQLKKIQQGSVLPVQMTPFSQDGRLFQELKQQKIATIVNFQKGQEAEIIAGQLTGYFGTVQQIKQNTAVIKCRTKGMEGTMLQQPLDHLSKRFKQSQRVKVTSGTDKGKTGIILKLEGRYAQIWTDNENTIKINKNNLQINLGEVINQENVHNLKKDDLIKTSKNLIGIVLSTTKDNIKILDMNNTIQIINNLDFDSKINSSLFLTKNKNNQQIRNNSIVRIRQGIHEGIRCVVKHVYKDYVFLFNDSLDKTSGMTVQKADNCAVLAKTSDSMKKGFNKAPQKTNNFDKQIGSTDDEFKVGKAIVISTGPLKGYRGVIKSINKDRIQVRVPQKSTTQWITKSNLVASNKDNMELGKTPRRMGMSTYQQPGMSPNSYYN